MTVLTLHAEVSVGHNVVRSCFLHGTLMSRTETNTRQEDATKENPAENATAPGRKKDGKLVGRRRTAHYSRRMRVSHTQLDGAGRDDRRTAARRRLDDDCCGWPPAAGNINRYAIALCPVVLRRIRGSSQLFHPKLRR